MKLESLFHQLLGLGDCWEVVSLAVHEESGTVEIAVRETKAVWAGRTCPVDGEALSPHGHAEERRWRHLNIFQYRCEIVCALPRGRCGACGKTVTLEPPWAGKSKGFTLMFEAMCLLLLRDMPVASLARFVGEQDTRLWRMLSRHVEQARQDKDMSEVDAVACDELAVRKGHVYATVFADARRRDVLFATETKEDTTWRRFAEDLRGHGGDPERIKHASMDMSRSYQAGARRHCPGAKLVFDKFHVIKLANEAVDRVRRRESSELPWCRESMKKSRYIWLKNPDNLTEAQSRRLEQMGQLNLSTAKAYRMRLNLQDIYASADHLRAHRRLRAWVRHVRISYAKDSLLAPMAKLAKTIAGHLDGILAHWDGMLTNAYMEGLMSVFSATKRKARGYRSFRNLATMLYFTGSHLSLPQFHPFNRK